MTSETDAKAFESTYASAIRSCFTQEICESILGTEVDWWNFYRFSTGIPHFRGAMGKVYRYRFDEWVRGVVLIEQVLRERGYVLERIESIEEIVE